jgi:hypothetical protein
LESALFLKKEEKSFHKTLCKRFVKTSLCRNFEKNGFKKEKPTLRWRMFSRKLLLKNPFSKRNFARTSAKI